MKIEKQIVRITPSVLILDVLLTIAILAIEFSCDLSDSALK
jgi:hypothetical protein